MDRRSGHAYTRPGVQVTPNGRSYLDTSKLTLKYLAAHLSKRGGLFAFYTPLGRVVVRGRGNRRSRDDEGLTGASRGVYGHTERVVMGAENEEKILATYPKIFAVFSLFQAFHPLFDSVLFQ